MLFIGELTSILDITHNLFSIFLAFDKSKKPVKNYILTIKSIMRSVINFIMIAV